VLLAAWVPVPVARADQQQCGAGADKKGLSPMLTAGHHDVGMSLRSQKFLTCFSAGFGHRAAAGAAACKRQAV
jgi:hypothetical protein